MRTKNAIKIILSSTLLQVTVAISGLILPPLLISHYGSETNGLISSIKQIITYFSIVSIGLGAASSVALYKPLKEKDWKNISEILSATRVFFNRTGYVFGGLVMALTIIYPIVVKSSLGYFQTICIVFILSVSGVFEYIIISKYRILLIADQKNSIVSWITTQGVIINTIISVILIKLNVSIVLIQLISTIVYLLRLLLTKKYVKKLYPQVNYYAKPKFDSISGRWDAFGYQLPGMIITYTPLVLITFFLGLKSSSVYSIYNIIYSSIAMIIGVFSAGINASFGNVMANNDQELLQKSYDTYKYIFYIISFTLYTTALLLTIPFIKVYIDNNDGVNYVLPFVAVGFAISGLFRGLRTPALTIIEAAGKFKENKLANLYEAIANVIISLALIEKFDIMAVLIAAAVTGLIRSIMYVVYNENNILMRSYKNTITIIILNLLLGGAIIYIGGPIISKVEINSLFNWFMIAIPTTLIVFVIVVILNSLTQKKCLMDFLSRVKVILKIKM